MFFSCSVFVLSGRGLCDGPISRPEESYRLRCVYECDQVQVNNLDTYCERVEEVRTTIRRILGCLLMQIIYLIKDKNAMWYVAPRNLVVTQRRFGETRCLSLRAGRMASCPRRLLHRHSLEISNHAALVII
jgi:hypothetical protein